MKTKSFLKAKVGIAAMALFLLAAITGSAAQTITPGQQAPDFTIKDQFDHDTKLSDYKGKLILLICWDRVGNDYVQNWMNAVRKVYPAGPDRVVTLVFVASMKGVPGFLREGIKQKYQKTTDGKTNGPIILDWDCVLPKTYGFHEDRTNVYLVDGNGVFRISAYGKGTPEEVEPVLREIGKITANAPKAANSTEARH